MDTTEIWDKVITATIGFIFGLLGFWIQSYLKKEKRSLVANMTTYSLLSLPESIRDQLKVEFQGSAVKNVISHVITFYNDGNKVIENHSITCKMTMAAKLLHLDPGKRFTIKESSEKNIDLVLSFLNPGESSEFRIHTTGDLDEDINIEAEGPGVQFKLGEKLLPVLDPNATREDLFIIFKDMMLGNLKKNAWKVLVLYIVIIAFVFIAFEIFGS